MSNPKSVGGLASRITRRHPWRCSSSCRFSTTLFQLVTGQSHGTHLFHERVETCHRQDSRRRFGLTRIRMVVVVMTMRFGMLLFLLLGRVGIDAMPRHFNLLFLMLSFFVLPSQFSFNNRTLVLWFLSNALHVFEQGFSPTLVLTEVLFSLNGPERPLLMFGTFFFWS